jgi:folate-binding protein YgfZ
MIDVKLDRNRLDSLRHGSTVVLDDSAVIRLSGPGALDCLQGIFTNDVVIQGDQYLIYGAFLTPKGMIITDCWVLRAALDPVLILPASRVDGALELFKRALPPRLAQVTDLRTQWSVAWLFGESVGAVLEGFRQGGVPSPPGSVTTIEWSQGPLFLASGPSPGPFQAVLLGDTRAVDSLRKQAIADGATLGTSDDKHAARVLAGWPAMESEIGDRTLPQEVRFDHLKGVSHIKGCYTGQETVARLHFRGHTNKEIRGLRWDGGERLESHAITRDEKEMGIIHSMLRLPDRTLALGMIRTTVKVGDHVRADDREATVVPLPFQAADIEA